MQEHQYIMNEHSPMRNDNTQTTFGGGGKINPNNIGNNYQSHFSFTNSTGSNMHKQPGPIGEKQPLPEGIQNKYGLAGRFSQMPSSTVIAELVRFHGSNMPFGKAPAKGVDLQSKGMLGMGLGGLHGDFGYPAKEQEGNYLGKYPNLMSSNLEQAYKPFNNEYIANKDADKPIEQPKFIRNQIEVNDITHDHQMGQWLTNTQQNSILGSVPYFVQGMVN